MLIGETSSLAGFFAVSPLRGLLEGIDSFGGSVHPAKGSRTHAVAQIDKRMFIKLRLCGTAD
jgi:hypothetical protein